MSQEKIERWNEVDGNLDNGEKLQAFLDSTTDAYAILQLRRTDETVYERFESYEALKRPGINDCRYFLPCGRVPRCS